MVRRRRCRHEVGSDAARGERRVAAGGGKVGAAAVVAVARPAGRAKTRVSAGGGGGRVLSFQ